jgi:hypothetical protein
MWWAGYASQKFFLVKFNEGQNELTLQHVPISMVAEKKATWRLVLADLHCRLRCLISSMHCLHRLSPNCSLILDDIGLFSLIKTMVFLNYITAWWTGEARFSAPLGVQSQVGGPLADSTKDKWVARSRKNGAFCFCPGEMDRNFSASRNLAKICGWFSGYDGYESIKSGEISGFFSENVTGQTDSWSFLPATINDYIICLYV